MTDTAAAPRFTIICLYCNRHVLARPAWVGREVRCPHCSGVLRVPEPAPANIPVRARQPAFGPNRYFNFACGRCKSLLETHTGMCGQAGRCPTCAASFIVPEIDDRTGLPAGEAQVADDGENPTPMHAYAASGSQAPQIVSGADGVSRIECRRCGGVSPVDADACEGCGVPFTIEAAPTTRDHDVSRLAWTAVGCGLLALASSASGLFLICAIVAIITGIAAASRASKSANLILAIIGIAGAVLGVGLFIYFRL